MFPATVADEPIDSWAGGGNLGGGGQITLSLHDEYVEHLKAAAYLVRHIDEVRRVHVLWEKPGNSSKAKTFSKIINLQLIQYWYKETRSNQE